MQIQFRKANFSDVDAVWKIIQQAIRRRKEDGSTQWQSGYPNLKTVENDIEKGYCYLLTSGKKIIASAALIFNDEPSYNVIDGNWLSNGNFLVIHRMAVSDDVLRKGIATEFFSLIEKFAKENGIFSVKVDTNFDNDAMLYLLNKLNYTYCGEVQVADGPRKAFEKLLK